MLVIGAGVIGLSTGVLLAERLGARVEIVAAELPQATTSAAATGMCGPVFRGPDERAVRWELATVAHLSELAATSRRPGCGGRPGWPRRRPGWARRPPLADESALVRLAEPGELPAGFGFGMWVRIPLVDLPVYLRYLADRFAAAGGRLRAGPGRRAGRRGRAGAGAGQLHRVGAAALCADRELRPVRGQQVVVANPGLEGFFMPAPGASEWASWHAHGDHVLLGGVALDGDWDTRAGAGDRRRDHRALRPAGTAAGRGDGHRAPGGAASGPAAGPARGRGDRLQPLRAPVRARLGRRAAVLGQRAGGGRAGRRSGSGPG